MPTTESRLGLKFPLGPDPVTELRLGIKNHSDILAPIVVVGYQGTLAARPAAAAAHAGKRIYTTTDEGDPRPVYLDIGTAWVRVNPASVVDGPVDDGTLRTLGTGALQALPGNHASTTNERVPTNNSVTAAKLHTGLKPSTGAGAGTEAVRALGTAAGTAATGIHAAQHAPSGADPLAMQLFNLSGTFAARPAAAAANRYLFYWAYDTKELYFNRTGSAWELVAEEPPEPPEIPDPEGSIRVYEMDNLAGAAQSRTNTAYGLMTTPDRVQGVVVDALSLVFIEYRAKVFRTSSATYPGKAALFMGSTQIPNVERSLTTGEASVNTTGAGGVILLTNGGGLNASADVDGGGVFSDEPFITSESGDSGIAQVRLPAGTHDISVQFKNAQSGQSVYRSASILTVTVISP